MQKGFAPILIVLLIALGIGGYLIYTNYSNNQTKPVSNSKATVSSPYPASSAITEIQVPSKCDNASLGITSINT